MITANQGALLQPDANRLAFADPEFLLSREVRGIRMQLEMLKPKLAQAAYGVESTIGVFGGAGVMEAVNRGAHDAGAVSVGLNIALSHEQGANAYVMPELSFKFHYFALRKMHFMMRAKALVAFPGGFGTLDELFEVLTLVQTREDGMELEVVFYDEKAISVELPTSVVREVTWTEPAVKGDTSGKVLKPAKIATGFDVGVPIFVAQGDKIEIDTRTGEYRKRV